MNKKKKVIIMGGDNRQRMLCSMLRDDGYEVIHIEDSNEEYSNRIREADALVLPVPVSKDRVNIFSDDPLCKFELLKVCGSIGKDTCVFGGGFSGEIKELFEKEEIEYHDMLQSELFTVENAYLTVQGALRLLFENTEENLLNKKAIVTGYGRISVFLSDALKRLGMKVYVLARNEIQLKTAELSGMKAIRLTESPRCSEADFIFNTVPNVIFDRKSVETMKKSAVYFELASAPFGAVKEDFLPDGCRYVLGSSLPGRFLPAASAKIIKNYIEQFL